MCIPSSSPSVRLDAVVVDDDKDNDGDDDVSLVRWVTEANEEEHAACEADKDREGKQEKDDGANSEQSGKKGMLNKLELRGAEEERDEDEDEEEKEVEKEELTNELWEAACGEDEDEEEDENDKEQGDEGIKPWQKISRKKK